MNYKGSIVLYLTRIEYEKKGMKFYHSFSKKHSLFKTYVSKIALSFQLLEIVRFLYMVQVGSNKYTRMFKKFPFVFW